MAKDRTEYFKERNKNVIRFAAEYESKELSKEFDAFLNRHGLTKKAWLNAKINEDLNNER